MSGSSLAKEIIIDLPKQAGLGSGSFKVWHPSSAEEKPGPFNRERVHK